MKSQESDRVFGFDLLRAIAIILVVLEHSKNIFPYQMGYLLAIKLPDGVDLFFVLSGYLIGGIIIKTIEKEQTINLPITANFLIRRWFRTLPNYFLFLIINIILIYFALIPGQINKFLITYLGFFQNFHKSYIFLFWESWSLSVEEWFYLLFPLILTLLFQFKKTKSDLERKNRILTGILIIMLFPLCYRVVQASALLDTDIYFRKLVLTRLDTIAFGLLAAYLGFYHRLFWNKYKNSMFVLGVFIMLVLLNLNIEAIYYKQTFFFTLMSLSIALLLPRLSAMKQAHFFSKSIQNISKISYSIYLVHLPVKYLLIGKIGVNSNSIFLYLSFWIITLLIAGVVFRYYEKPLMNIRDKIKIGV